MLVLLPVVILIFSAAAILVLQRIRPGFGYTWLIASGSSLVSWGLTLYFHWRTPPIFSLFGWQPIQPLSSSLSFNIDSISWPFAFSMASLLLAVIFTSSARLQNGSNPYSWAASMVISSVGILAILAANPLTLVLTWTAIDLIELVVRLGTNADIKLSQQSTIAFSIRIGGTLMLIWAMVLSSSQGQILAFENVLPGVGIFLLLAGGLRLGVVPLHLPYTQEIRTRRGVGSILRLASPASSLVLLARMPAAAVPGKLIPYLLFFAAMAAIYGAAMWFWSENELKGRPYWVIALAGIAFSSAIRGESRAVISWGIVMVLAGGLIFLFSASNKLMTAILLAGCLTIIGLPFTPAVSGWKGIFSGSFNILSVGFLVAYLLLLTGYLRFTLAGGESIADMERWIQVIYPFGLILCVLALWIIGIFGWKGSFTLGLWWAGLISAAFSIAGLFWILRGNRATIGRITEQKWLIILARRLGRFLAAIVRLGWFYGILKVLYQLIQQIVMSLTTIFEGDGGILWAILLLTILISVIKTGMIP
ncbi:MAG: hypothetical protein P4L50_02430 [Anaerolineaceae bacterium]|nr:hypothetical protein [Anaerolineaceae bacterium]